MKTLVIRTENTELATQVRLADRFFTRLRGLMLRKSLADGEGLLLKNCSAIHCCFMRFPIDVVYLDTEMRVVGKETVRPWHVGGRFRGARHVLELGENEAKDVTTGMQLTIKEREP